MTSLTAKQKYRFVHKCVIGCIRSMSSLHSVQDWCFAGQVVPTGGSAGLLWGPVGQHAGHPHGATACFSLYCHTFWPNGITESTSVHARLWSPCSGEWKLYLRVQSFYIVVMFNLCFPVCSSIWQVKSVCLCLQDSNVLVQRNMLEILLYFFPFATCQVGTHMNTFSPAFCWTTSLALSYLSEVFFCFFWDQKRGLFTASLIMDH